VILTHALHIAERDDDLETLACRGVSVGYCPVVMWRSGRFLRSFGHYHRAGLNIGLGADTSPPDTVEEMRWGRSAANWRIGMQPRDWHVRYSRRRRSAGHAPLVG
jgi:cytosine/adenosine deaminase-related metal-dependent hydrolase